MIGARHFVLAVTAGVAVMHVGAVSAVLDAQPRMTARALADIAVVSVPTNLKSPAGVSEKLKPEFEAGDNGEEPGRLTFTFTSPYFRASFGSVTTYKQLLTVSVMAPDATTAEYAALPRAWKLGYEQRTLLQTSTVGSGELTISEGVYSRGSLSEPSYEFVYRDRARRLQIVWHAVKREMDLATGSAQIGRIAASFRITRDPVAMFAALRDAPRQAAVTRSSRLATVTAMLQREGFAVLEPGKPVLRNGVYVEWISDPEPRYQLLVPLGRVRAAANGSVLGRPRPIAAHAGPSIAPMAGTIGWREVDDGAWRFFNNDNAYLPMTGTQALLAAQQADRGFVYFYYIGTVRVDEVADDTRLTSLRWFLDDVPAVQRRWREGTLVGPGKPEPH